MANVSRKPVMKSILLAITLAVFVASPAVLLTRSAMADGCGGCTLAATDFGPRGNWTTLLLIAR